MRGGTFVHRFGPFEFDPATGRLFHGSSVVRLPEPQSAMLRTLIANAGDVVSQEVLLEAAWGNVVVTPDSVRQSISRLRKTLSVAQDGLEYIDTIPNRGYRFAERVDRAQHHAQAVPPGVDLRAHDALLRGRADLVTLNLDKTRRAQKHFEEALATRPHFVEGHIG